jgi:16S rRNA (adenine1518-N6/adenine1519-N6)-dimethyltransferase
MALYKPSELIAFLESLGIAPRKGLSQNFLIDGNILQNILKAADLQPGDQVLEVGPGPGALTEALLNAGASVVAVEMDRILAEALHRFSTPSNHLRVINQDILKASWETIHSSFPDPQRKIKLIANLPYHITTPVLTRFIPLHKEIDSIVVMVQDEVGKRMAAEPGTPDFGSLSLFLSFYATAHYAFKVGRKCFFPAPKVDSAIVKLVLKPPPEGIDPEAFFSMTRHAFQHRRKVVRSSLKTEFPGLDIEKILETLHLSPLVRPEELSLEQWLQIYHLAH